MIGVGGTKPLNVKSTAAVEKKILVVDDDRHCRDGLRDSLLGAGYSVETAADSREAIEKVKARLFEVAIIDLDLPPVLGIATSGWELVRIFRDFYPAITVIVVGAEEDKQVKARAAQLKVSEFLEKPISPARLKMIVKTL